MYIFVFSIVCPRLSPYDYDVCVKAWNKVRSFDLQFGMGGWFRGYSYRCQPVDYSNSEVATRVSKKSALLHTLTQLLVNSMSKRLPKKHNAPYTKFTFLNDYRVILPAYPIVFSRSICWQNDAWRHPRCETYIYLSYITSIHERPHLFVL